MKESAMEVKTIASNFDFASIVNKYFDGMSEEGKIVSLFMVCVTVVAVIKVKNDAKPA